MDPEEWVFRLMEAGYSTEQILDIERKVSLETNGPWSLAERREAAYRYLIICTDIDKLAGFLQFTDQATRVFCTSYDEASNFVAHVIAGWC